MRTIIIRVTAIKRFLILLTLALTALNFDAANGGIFDSVAKAAKSKNTANVLIFGSFYDEKARKLPYAKEHDFHKVILADWDADVNADVTGQSADLCNIKTYADIPDARFDEIHMTHIGRGLPVDWHQYGSEKKAVLAVDPATLNKMLIIDPSSMIFDKHIDLSPIVAEWHRILKPGGRLIWTSMAGDYDGLSKPCALGFIEQYPGNPYTLYEPYSELALRLSNGKVSDPPQYGQLVPDEETLIGIYHDALLGLFDIVSVGPEDEKKPEATKLVIRRKV